MLLAKDAGERSGNGCITGYITYRGDGWLRQVTAGDYRIEAGQGVAMWKGRDFSKGGNILTPALRKSRGVVTSLSGDESSYLRGAAIQASVAGIDAAILISARTYAANADPDHHVSALYASGYYRTENEVQKRGALGEKLFGTRLSAAISSSQHVGFTFYRTDFSAPLSLDGGARFEGTGYTLAAIDFAGVYRGLSAFAECVMAGKTFAGIGGFSLLPSGGLSFALVARAYPHSFYSAHGSGFGDRSENFNEYGMYMGMQAVIGRLTCSGYFDHTRVPMEEVLHFPASENEFHGSARIKVTEAVTADVQYHSSSRVSESSPEEGSDEMRTGARAHLQRLRIQGEFRFASAGEMRIRCEQSILRGPSQNSPETGLLVYGDVAMRFGRIVWGNLRLVLFKTDSYATRIAEYERDLGGVASIPSLYGSGIRWYLLMRFRPSQHIRFNIKYADLIRDDVRSIGTGLEALTTNHDNRLSAELEMTF